MNYTVIKTAEATDTDIRRLYMSSIIFWKDHHLPVGFFTSAFGFDSRMIAQGNMDNASFGRGHGLKGLTPSTLGNLIRHAHCHLDQLLFAAVAITFHIHSELDELLLLLANDQRSNILERAQRLGAPPN